MKRFPITNGVIKFLSLVLLVGLYAETAAAQTPGGEQQVWVVKRGDLSISGAASPGTVSWGLLAAGKPGTSCGLTFDGTNTNEIMMRLTDNGGFSGDPTCELFLKFASLKNHYTFEGVNITTYDCGNFPCSQTVLRPGTPGSNSLDVSVRGKMKGTVFSNVNSIFRVTPTLSGPVNFSPFVEQAKPDFVVSTINKSTNGSGLGSCGVSVTLANLGDPDWIDRQPFAYSTDPGHAVLISLLKDNVVCGSSSVTLNQFDPNRVMDAANQAVTLTWPGCSFSGAASFTVTVDAGTRLLERDEITGKSKTVQLQCSPFR
jgi:hypothetical protein